MNSSVICLFKCSFRAPIQEDKSKTIYFQSLTSSQIDDLIFVVGKPPQTKVIYGRVNILSFFLLGMSRGRRKRCCSRTNTFFTAVPRKCQKGGGAEVLTGWAFSTNWLQLCTGAPLRCFTAVALWCNDDHPDQSADHQYQDDHHKEAECGVTREGNYGEKCVRMYDQKYQKMYDICQKGRTKKSMNKVLKKVWQKGRTKKVWKKY